MKPLLQLVALSLALSAPLTFAQTADTAAAKAPTHVYKAKTPKLNKAQVDQLLANASELVIIDLRRPDELTAHGGFPVYLSIQAKDLESALAFIPKDRTLITVSNHAGRAGRGADLLASKGFKVVGAVGALDYQAEGGKLSKIAPPAPKPATAAE